MQEEDLAVNRCGETRKHVMAALSRPSSPSEVPDKVIAFPRCPTSARIAAAIALSADERIDLDRLRWLALRSLVSPKPDFERACFLLAGEAGVSLDRFANAFFRGLADKARRPMEFYRPGTRGVSEDEMWLIRLLAACRRSDEAGIRALVAWRVAPDGRRWLRFLAVGIMGLLGAAS